MYSAGLAARACSLAGVLRCASNNRQTHLKTSLAAGVLKHNPAAVRFGDLPRHSQTQANALGFAGGERLEQSFDDFAWRAGAIVEDAQE